MGNIVSIGLILFLGIIFLFLKIKERKDKSDIDALDKELTDLMYRQHEQLFLLQGTLVDQENVEKSFFYQKNKFLIGPKNKSNLLDFIQKGGEDILFLQKLKKL